MLLSESVAGGDFLRGRPGPGFEESVRGLAGALVFFTTTGGGGVPRELIADPGRTLIELPGLCENDGALLAAGNGREGGGIASVVDIDAALSLRADFCVD